MEEDGGCLLLELVLFRSFPGSDKGLTLSNSKWDLVCLKGVSLAQWSRRVNNFDLSRNLVTFKGIGFISLSQVLVSVLSPPSAINSSLHMHS